MEEKKKLSDALYELDDLDAPLWAIAGELETLWDSMANGNYDACPAHIGAVYSISARMEALYKQFHESLMRAFDAWKNEKGMTT